MLGLEHYTDLAPEDKKIYLPQQDTGDVSPLLWVVVICLPSHRFTDVEFIHQMVGIEILWCFAESYAFLTVFLKLQS